MKTFFCTCVLALLSFTAFGQVDAKLNAGSAITGGINVSADIGLDYSNSLAIGLGRANTKVTISDNEYNYRRFRIIPEYRHYFNPRNGADGLFAGAYGRVAFFKAEAVTEGEDVDGVRVGLGALFGNKWAYDSGFVLELNGGLGYGKAFGNDENAQISSRLLNFLPGLDVRLGILVGYRFGR